MRLFESLGRDRPNGSLVSRIDQTFYGCAEALILTRPLCSVLQVFRVSVNVNARILSRRLTLLASVAVKRSVRAFSGIPTVGHLVSLRVHAIAARVRVPGHRLFDSLGV